VAFEDRVGIAVVGPTFDYAPGDGIIGSSDDRTDRSRHKERDKGETLPAVHGTDLHDGAPGRDLTGMASCTSGIKASRAHEKIDAY
jgi:hypothetical protein